MIHLRHAALLCGVLLCACAQPQPETPDPNIPFRVIGEGHDSVITLAKNLSIQTSTEFNELWRVHDGGRNPPPKIDFTTQQVLGIFLGQKYTGGYAVSINRIESSNGQTNVYVVVTTPAPNSQQSMALTQPYVLIVMPRTRETLKYQVIQNK